MQVGPALKNLVGWGWCADAEVQQMRASGDVQSELCLHDFGQLTAHSPSQQLSPFAVRQSLELSQTLGHSA